MNEHHHELLLCLQSHNTISQYLLHLVFSQTAIFEAARYVCLMESGTSLSTYGMAPSGHKLLSVDSAKTILIQVASQKSNRPITKILLILVDH